MWGQRPRNRLTCCNSNPIVPLGHNICKSSAYYHPTHPTGPVLLITQSRLIGDSHRRRKLSWAALCPCERCLMRGQLQVLRSDRLWKIYRSAFWNSYELRAAEISRPPSWDPWLGRGCDHLAVHSSNWLQSRSWFASWNVTHWVDCPQSSW